MKRIVQLFFFLLFIGLTMPETQAQVRGFGVSWVTYNFEEPTARSHDFNLNRAWKNSKPAGFEFAYIEHFNDHAGFVVPFKVGHTRFPVSRENVKQQTDRLLFANLDGLFRYSIRKARYRVVPYVQFGVGTQNIFDTDLFTVQMPLGAGLNVKLFQGWYLSAQSEYRIDGRGRGIDGIVSHLGLVMDLGPRIKPDLDGDGISDDDDLCPTVPGILTFKGCPDSDMDGIQDSGDKCPTVAGLPVYSGCPDTDGDGIIDGEDTCPTEAGTIEFKGCPDTDGDGLADNVDKCPKEKGLKENQGCPEKDSDGDGVIDKNDGCPTVKGLAALRGCPDKDGDGITDADDRCPDVKGDAKNKGCPDKDGDGVVDIDDKCIDKPGPASNQGCPEMKAEEKKKLEFAMRAVQFETGSSKLTKGSMPVLDEIAGILAGYPEYNLRIEGHTDNVGEDARNQTLSAARAQTCLEYLAGRGIDRGRMVSSGFGEDRPMADNATKSGRDLNRRVEFNTFLK